MKNQHVKKLSFLVLAGFICAAGVGKLQVASAEQTAQAPKVEIGQKFIAPELKLKENTYVLDYKMADVNGDSVEDKVILVGTKEMIDGTLDAYADNLSIVVQDGKTQGYVKHDWVYKGTDGTLYGEFGREPNLIIGDYTGDKVNDIIVTAPQGGNGGYVDHLVLALEESKLKMVFADNQSTVEQ
ncbi:MULTISPECIES: hypothetical protein [Bacillales]|uniref:hypothetical protein n=1 Tax=Bacillales TaxID=1385 RepID=UPI0003480CA3|nr:MULTISPECIES: hypothetical protein [Bacillales]KMZ44205.1 hypothetical protein AC624_25710 [Bacillus sp. FJAT-27238]